MLTLVPVDSAQPRYLPEQEGDVAGLVFAPDDKLLAMFGEAPFVSLVDPITGKESIASTPRLWQDVSTRGIHLNGKQLAAGCCDHTIRFWTVTNGKTLGERSKPETKSRTPFNLALAPMQACHGVG